VILEKPFTTKLEHAKELVQIAREKGLYLIDAVPTACLPNLEVIRDHLSEIGRIRLVMANYSQYSSRYDNLLEDKVGNVFNPEYCGGCLMDINYYNLFINIALFGKPEHAVYYPNRWKNGIDTSGVLVMQYPDFISTNVGAKDTWGDNFLVIEGEKGHIRTQTSNWLKQLHVVTKTTDEVLSLQEPGTNYLYEIQAIAALLLQEDRQALSKYQQTTLDVMEVLESVRLDAGIRFPVDCE
jgi:predicted dehydrogenase